MGNSFICTPIEYLKIFKSNICFHSQCIENNEEQIIINLNINNNKIGYEKSITELKDYFNKRGNEIIGDLIKKEKSKKHLSKKKHINALNKLSDNKYELMLKRLLEQKKEKRKGPKRRETIKKNDEKFKLLIKEVILENINTSKNEDITINKENKENDLLIKNINNPKYRYSATTDKNAIISNNLNKYLVLNKYNYQYRNTINEIINESSGFSGGFCKKLTKQSSSSKNKKNEYDK